MKFKNGDVAVIARTGSPALDGHKVVITGVSYDSGYGTAFFIIKHVQTEDTFFYNGEKWESITLTEHCLDMFH